MKVKAWVLQQPALNGGSFMSAVVVEDHMDGNARGHFGINLVEELAELQRPMAAVELAITLPLLASRAANNEVVPLRL